jgi:hypothetical protein
MDYRYIGTRGAYLPSVPARDLAHDELTAIARRRRQPVQELRKELKASGLYELVPREDGDDKPKTAKRPKPAAPSEPPGTAEHPPLGPVQTAPDGTMVETQRPEPKAP